MEALGELLDERPFGEITVSDISERATINRATFYAHFEDKSHLVESMLKEGLEHEILSRIDHPAPFNVESLVIVATATMEFMVGTLRPCRKSHSELVATFGLTVQQALERLFLLWMEHHPPVGKPFPGSAEVLANALAWSIYGASVRWALHDKRPPAELVARETVQLFLR